ncbi:MAG: fumarate hydratase [Clostridia bacterium]|nr:fumarate hydratase [Clostridia bacterium]
MKEINVSRITDTVAELCIRANKILPCALRDKLQSASADEPNELAKSVLNDLERNLDAAAEMDLPICQDTGMAVVFVKIGQEVHLTGGLLNDAVNEGVRRGYTEGLLRCSVVEDPLRRKNTGDNTPCVLHTEIVAGDTVEITVAPKGFGSENKSGLGMLTPFDGRQGVINAVLDIVRAAGSCACPPMVIGVGIGGDFEACALLAKKALCRDVSTPNADPYYAELEAELLAKVNETDIGPQGFGGQTTALALMIEAAPTHIAGLPVAVNIGCHVTRHATAVIEE